MEILDENLLAVVVGTMEVEDSNRGEEERANQMGDGWPDHR